MAYASYNVTIIVGIHATIMDIGYSTSVLTTALVEGAAASSCRFMVSNLMRTQIAIMNTVLTNNGMKKHIVRQTDRVATLPPLIEHHANPFEDGVFPYEMPSEKGMNARMADIDKQE